MFPHAVNLDVSSASSTTLKLVVLKEAIGSSRRRTVTWREAEVGRCDGKCLSTHINGLLNGMFSEVSEAVVASRAWTSHGYYTHH